MALVLMVKDVTLATAERSDTMVKLTPIQCPHSSRLGTPMVTLANNRLRLNAAFAQVANLHRYAYMGLYTTDEGDVAVKFFKEPQYDEDTMYGFDPEDYGDRPAAPHVVAMQPDGGGKDVKGRVVTCGQVIEHNEILRLARKAFSAKCRQFVPLRDADANAWILKPTLDPRIDGGFEPDEDEGFADAG